MNKMLNRRHFQLIFLCFFAYMISYIGRLGYNTNIQNFIDSYNVTKLQAGYASSAFFFCYGAGQLINGILCEKLNSEKLVSCSLVASSLISFSLFFFNNIIIIAIIWGINGLLLSTLWCNLVKITSKIKDKKYLDKSITWLAISLPAGTLLAYAVSSLLTLLNCWKIYFIFSGSVMLGGGILFLLTITKVQKDIDTLSINTSKPDKIKIANEENKLSLLKFLSITIIPIFLISVLSSIIKDGVQTWMPTYLKENFEIPTYFSILITLILPLFGLMAIIFAKWLMKKVDNIFITIFIILTTALILITGFLLSGSLTVLIPIIIFAFLSFLMHALNSVFTAIFPIFYKDKIKSGPTAGIFNCFAYVGSAISTFALGGIVDSFGWKFFSVTLAACALLSALLAIWGYISMQRKA